MRKKSWPAIPGRGTAYRLANRAPRWYFAVHVTVTIIGVLAAGGLLDPSPPSPPLAPSVAPSNLLFLDLVIFGWVVCKFRTMSTRWAVVGLILVGLNLALSGFTSPVAWITEIVLLLKLINGVRATRDSQRWNKPQPTNWISSSFPPGRA